MRMGFLGMNFALPLLLVLAHPALTAPNTYHPTEAIWGTLRRCDMLDRATTNEYVALTPGFTSLHGGWKYPYPAYTDGQWVGHSITRPSITASLAVACDDRHNLVCTNFHSTCYGDRRSASMLRMDLNSSLAPEASLKTQRSSLSWELSVFAQQLQHLKWSWQPSNGCYFAPVAPMNKWFEWSRGLEADTGPMLWVGDTMLGEFFQAFSQLTQGAVHSSYVRSDSLVNSWTLTPMTPAEITSCVSTSGASSGVATVPCPPTVKTLWWDDNTHHQLPMARWTETFETQASTLRTLVINMGSEWWRQYLFPSQPAGCHTLAGQANAYAPLTSLGLTNDVYQEIWRNCDVFDTKFKTMAANVAIYLNSVSAFTGHVVIVTSPPGQKGCAGSSAPNQPPSTSSASESDMTNPAFWFDTNPEARLADGRGGHHYFGKLKVSEHAWRDAFGKHAKRLKLSVLNITSISEARADARVRDSACQRFCYPGVPHHWSTMMLRLLEQHVYGLYDGLGAPRQSG